MQESLVMMQAALRVLTALTDQRQPSPLDLEMLGQYGGPQPVGIGLDEYACSIVQKAINRRAGVRASAAPNSLTNSEQGPADIS
jgi:hypothetical protein